ncbi:hypothetical protein JRQ81_018692 [Phrynocephalus forsythii]|uniref:Nucleoporin NUP42 n=1 Tax=Phrynocephalus forsythii TaxID=171643 RepID=A0A9Q0XPP5_9SAUR|nr:hypothetical protein JRQ81_018692 [Phrynocephalus forsythii]
MARHGGGVCSYFLQGNCRFGDRCWNEHPRYGRSKQAYSQNSGSSRRGGWSDHNQRYSNVVQASSFSKSSSWRDSRDPGSFSQNRFNVLNASENLSNGGIKDEEEKLLEIIRKDMEIWESSGQWMFSTYAPMKEKPNISGFSEFLPEELRLEYYNCRASNDTQNYINSVQQLLTQWRTRLHELKNINASTKAALISEFKNAVGQPPPAFGFGGQQTSTFGASSFSFKSPPELTSIPSGSTPAFGGTPAFGSTPSFGNLTGIQNTTTISAAPHSAGFGNLMASSPASFSFKMSSNSGELGAPGFSGFGKSFPVGPSGTPSASGFGASVATSTLNTGSTAFGQPANVFGVNATLASPEAPTRVTSETLFTPKAELSAEELKQFEAKRFTLGKIPLKPPPVELLKYESNYGWLWRVNIGEEMGQTVALRVVWTSTLIVSITLAGKKGGVVQLQDERSQLNPKLQFYVDTGKQWKKQWEKIGMEKCAKLLQQQEEAKGPEAELLEIPVNMESERNES